MISFIFHAWQKKLFSANFQNWNLLCRFFHFLLGTVENKEHKAGINLCILDFINAFNNMNFAFDSYFITFVILNSICCYSFWLSSIFLVAKLHYNYLCPSVCPSVRFRGKRNFLRLWFRWRSNFFFCRFVWHMSIYSVNIFPSVCRLCYKRQKCKNIFWHF